MKKLYFIFILLFGFLTFVPQIALGDIPTPPYDPYGDAKREQIVEEGIKCFHKRKANISPNYQGPNLVLQEIYYSGCEWWNRTSSEEPPYPPTQNVYNIIIDDSKNDAIKIKSVTCNCSEYLLFSVEYFMNPYNYNDEYPEINSPYFGYNVTNVPPNSFLRFVKENNEMEVLPNSKVKNSHIIYNKREYDKTYSKIIATIEKAVKEGSYTKKNELQEKDFSEEIIASLETQDSESTKFSFMHLDELQLDYDTLPDFVIRGMLIALLLTIIIEGIIAIPFGWKFVGLVTLANIITNPALNGIIWHYQITNTQTILLLEAAVVLVEWGIFSVFIRQKYLKLFLFALVANAVSYLSGLLIF